MHPSCVIFLTCFLTSSSTGGRSRSVKRSRSDRAADDVMMVCPATAPCGKAVKRRARSNENGGRVTACPMAASHYLAAIGGCSRLASCPVPQPGPSWRVDTGMTPPQPGPSADETVVPKRLKTDCVEGYHVILWKTWSLLLALL